MKRIAKCNRCACSSRASITPESIHGVFRIGKERRSEPSASAKSSKEVYLCRDSSRQRPRIEDPINTLTAECESPRGWRAKTVLFRITGFDLRVSPNNEYNYADTALIRGQSSWMSGSTCRNRSDTAQSFTLYRHRLAR